MNASKELLFYSRIAYSNDALCANCVTCSTHVDELKLGYFWVDFHQSALLLFVKFNIMVVILKWIIMFIDK